MPEQEQQQSSEKDTAYYTALMTGFMESRREKDRSLLTLSGGGIGLLVTLLSTIGVSCLAEIALYALGLIIFVVVIFLILQVFEKDADLMIALRKDDDSEVTKLEGSLKSYDNIIKVLFIVGIVISTAIGILSAINQFNKRGSTVMSDKTTTPTNMQESVQGLSNFKVDTVDAIKSQTGLSTFKPVAKPSQQVSTTQTPTNDTGKQGGK